MVVYSSRDFTLEEWLSIAKILGSTRVCLAVAWAILIWDYLATLTLEYKHVYRSSKPFSALNITFYINRYVTVFTMCFMLGLAYLPETMVKTCQRSFWIQLYFPIITYVAASVIIILRVYAIWNRNVIVLSGLSFLLALQFAVQIWSIHRSVFSQIPDPVGGCGYLNDNALAWTFYASMLLFDTVVLILMLTRTGKMYFQGGISALTFVLLRDQVLFLLLTFAAGLANLILFTRPNFSDNQAMLAPFTLITVSIASNRILLNMRSLDDNHHHTHSISGPRAARTQHEQPAGLFALSSTISSTPPVHLPHFSDRLPVRDAEKGSEYELDYVTGSTVKPEVQ